jgi:hypothetical protein
MYKGQATCAGERTRQKIPTVAKRRTKNSIRATKPIRSIPWKNQTGLKLIPKARRKPPPIFSSQGRK